MCEKKEKESFEKMFAEMLAGMKLSEKKDSKQPDMTALFGAIMSGLNDIQKHVEEVEKESSVEEDVDKKVNEVMVAVEPQLRALIEAVIKNA